MTDETVTLTMDQLKEVCWAFASEMGWLDLYLGAGCFELLEQHGGADALHAVLTSATQRGLSFSRLEKWTTLDVLRKMEEGLPAYRIRIAEKADQ